MRKCHGKPQKYISSLVSALYNWLRYIMHTSSAVILHVKVHRNVNVIVQNCREMKFFNSFKASSCESQKIKLALVTVAFRAVYDFIFLSSIEKRAWNSHVIFAYCNVIALCFTSFCFITTRTKATKQALRQFMLFDVLFVYLLALALVVPFTSMFLFVSNI